MVAKVFSSNVVPPSDPDVRIPAGVRASAAKADAAFRAAYPDQVPAEANPPEPAAGEPAGAASPDQPQTPVQDQVAPAPSGDTPSSSERGQDINWEHRFNSMKGRHDKAQDSIKQ